MHEGVGRAPAAVDRDSFTVATVRSDNCRRVQDTSYMAAESESPSGSSDDLPMVLGSMQTRRDALAIIVGSADGYPDWSAVAAVETRTQQCLTSLQVFCSTTTAFWLACVCRVAETRRPRRQFLHPFCLPRRFQW